MRKYTLILFFLLWECSTLWAQNPADMMTPFTVRATYYSDIFVGRRTSSGEIFKQEAFTAAHHSLPLGTLLLVTNMESGCQVIVRVNDRCPRSGILDLTKRAAKILGIGSRTVEARILPQRYMFLWERQYELNDATRKGHLTELLRNTAGNVEPTDAESTKKPQDEALVCKESKGSKNGDANPTRSENTAKTAKNTVGSETVFYRLDLTTAPSRREAEDMIARRLPMKYQNECVVTPDGRSSRHRIILDVRLTEKEAKQMQKELRKSFPTCELRKITKND